MTVAELLSKADSQELTEWMAYAAIEPFGSNMDHYMIASLMALTANLQTGKKGKKFEPSDFLPRKKKPQSWEDMKAAMQQAFGGPG